MGRGPIPLIRQVEIRPVLDLLEEIGAPASPLLTRARLPQEFRDGGAPPLAARSVLSFVGAAARATSLPDLGWRSAVRAPVNRLGSWGEPLTRCWRLRDALQEFCRLYARDVSFVELGLSFGTDHAWLWRRRELPTRDPCSEEQGEQFMLGAMTQAVSFFAGASWQPPSVRVESASSDWLLGAPGLEHSEVRFGGRVLAIAVPYELLDLRAGRARPTVPAPAPMPPDTPGDFAGSLQRAVAPLVGEFPLSIDVGAEMCGTSPRTLRRWLAKEGSSWRVVVERARFEACERRILDPSCTLADLASELGYSDQSHFTFAFRRWTGETPGEYRRRRLKPDGGRASGH